MKKTDYIRPEVVTVKLHDLMQVTVISGQADEDSLGRRLDGESDNAATSTWGDTFENDAWQ